MRGKVFIGVLILLGGLVVMQQVRIGNLSDEVEALQALPERVEHASDKAIASIQEAEQSVQAQINDDLRDSLRAGSDLVLRQALSEFRSNLQSLRSQIEAEESRLQETRAERQRAGAGLPEQVSLDELNDYYRRKWQSTDGVSAFSNIESFDTARGPISFDKTDFSFMYIPSSRQLARLRIGKSNSTLNSQLIRAWLDESAEAKQRQGYRLISNRTRNADYGEYTEKLYRNGDMYFKTYYQYERVQGTYDRHSLQYTFYVEVGSDSRNEQYEMEQYNQKLGS